MKKYGFYLLFSLLMAAGLPIESSACTSAIISGRATPDGRPLLWKHRDTDELNNRVEFFDKKEGRKYAFIAVVNSNRTQGESWMGVNDAGFAIINTASSSMRKYDEDTGNREGILMYEALSCCATVADFEEFLKDNARKPRGVETNFGVIDAEGGAAYFETNSYDYTKFDVNDITVAPHGYLIYTNFSVTHNPDGGAGYARYATASDIFMKRVMSGGELTPQWIFNDLSRTYYNSILGIDLVTNASLTPNGWYYDTDFISRKSSASSAVIKGVKKGENPLLSAMWTVLGYPPVSVAVPLFVAMGKEQPALVCAAGEKGNAPICDAALERREKVYPLQRGQARSYLYFGAVYNASGTGYMQRLAPVENQVFQTFNSFLEESYSRNTIDRKKLGELYSRTDFGLSVR